MVCADGKLYPAKTAVPEGCTAVGILGKVTEKGHGLILALQDGSEQAYNDIKYWPSVTNFAGTTLKLLPDYARVNLASYTTLGDTPVSNWCVGQKSDYTAIFANLGSTTGHWAGKVFDANVNAYITTGVGGTAFAKKTYWCATAYDKDNCWLFAWDYWTNFRNWSIRKIRPVLGF